MGHARSYNRDADFTLRIRVRFCGYPHACTMSPGSPRCGPSSSHGVLLMRTAMLISCRR